MIGHEIFAKVDEEYMLDEFNLKGLNHYVPDLRHTIRVILGEDASDSEEEPPETKHDIGKYAEIAYGLIHARYIQTPKGMKQILHRYQKGVFGTCPRVYCDHQPLLPYGQSETPGISPVCFYCPRCQDLFTAQKARHEHIDGAYFGPNFAHIFIVQYSLIKPKQEFTGTIFGFKMHESSNNHPLKIRFDPMTGGMKVIARPKAGFTDPLNVIKPTRKFFTVIKPIPGE